MKIPKQVVETVEVKSVEVFAKVRDIGCYTLKTADGKEIAVVDDYVPRIFPPDKDGYFDSDYLILNIDLETGVILNWKKPDPEMVAIAFGLLKEEE